MHAERDYRQAGIRATLLGDHRFLLSWLQLIGCNSQAATHSLTEQYSCSVESSNSPYTVYPLSRLLALPGTGISRLRHLGNKALYKIYTWTEGIVWEVTTASLKEKMVRYAQKSWQCDYQTFWPFSIERPSVSVLRMSSFGRSIFWSLKEWEYQ